MAQLNGSARTGDVSCKRGLVLMLASVLLIVGGLAGFRFVGAVAPVFLVDCYSVAVGLAAAVVASGSFLIFLRMEERIRSARITVLGLLSGGLVLAAVCAMGLCLFANHALDGLALN